MNLLMDFVSNTAATPRTCVSYESNNCTGVNQTVTGSGCTVCDYGCFQYCKGSCSATCVAGGADVCGSTCGSGCTYGCSYLCDKTCQNVAKAI